jgi:hypothetical protein
MKKSLFLFICVITITFSFSSCEKIFPKKGCTDSKALNHDSDTDTDDGSCQYSSAIFYMSVLNPARPVTVTVNGSTVGIITAQYPAGPGNCSAPGCAIYKFKDGQKLDWVATEPGGLIWTGTIEPNSFQDCIKVRVY